MAQIFFSSSSKINNFTFCEICGYKKCLTKYVFSPLSFVAVFWIRDPGAGIRDPGSEMRDG
jgi:hypothetical protein